MTFATCKHKILLNKIQQSKVETTITQRYEISNPSECINFVRVKHNIEKQKQIN